MAQKKSLSWKIDKWDSGFFGVRIARIVYDGTRTVRYLTQRIQQTCDEACLAGARFVIVRINRPTPAQIAAFKQKGFVPKDDGVNLMRHLDGTAITVPVSTCGIKICGRDHYDSVGSLAQRAFRLSYFYRCGFASDRRVDAYHKRWLQNLVKQKDARVFTAQVDKRLAGFIAVGVDKDQKDARIVLIAVNSRFRGKGVGTALVNRSLIWAAKYCRRMYVRTQKDNQAAIALYARCGFCLDYSDVTLVKKIS